jgi:hypothetical protein
MVTRTEQRLRRRCPQLSCTDCSRLLSFARALRWAAPFFSRRQLVGLVDGVNEVRLDRDAAHGQCADQLKRRRDLGSAPQGLSQDLDGLLDRGLSQDPGDRPLTLQALTNLLGGPIGVGADVQVLAPIALTTNTPLVDQVQQGVVHPHPKQVRELPVRPAVGRLFHLHGGGLLERAASAEADVPVEPQTPLVELWELGQRVVLASVREARPVAHLPKAPEDRHPRPSSERPEQIAQRNDAAPSEQLQ